MKKALRYLLILLGIIAVAAGSFAAFVAFRGIPTYEAKKVETKVIMQIDYEISSA